MTVDELILELQSLKELHPTVERLEILRVTKKRNYKTIDKLFLSRNNYHGNDCVILKFE